MADAHKPRAFSTPPFKDGQPNNAAPDFMDPTAMKTLSSHTPDHSPQPRGPALKHLPTYLIVRAYASELISPRTPKPLLLVERMGVFPASGEIRCAAKDGTTLLARIKQRYATQALAIDERNGLSLVFADWRFSLQMCATGRQACLHVQSRGDVLLMQRKTRELLRLIAA